MATGLASSPEAGHRESRCNGRCRPSHRATSRTANRAAAIRSRRRAAGRRRLPATPLRSARGRSRGSRTSRSAARRPRCLVTARVRASTSPRALAASRATCSRRAGTGTPPTAMRARVFSRNSDRLAPGPRPRSSPFRSCITAAWVLTSPPAASGPTSSAVLTGTPVCRCPSWSIPGLPIGESGHAAGGTDPGKDRSCFVQERSVPDAEDLAQRHAGGVVTTHAMHGGPRRGGRRCQVGAAHGGLVRVPSGHRASEHLP